MERHALQQLALTVPERLERLVIIASAAQFADPPSWAVRAQQVREEGTGFLDALKADPEVTAALPPEALEALFDHAYHTAHVGTIFERVFGGTE